MRLNENEKQDSEEDEDFDDMKHKKPDMPKVSKKDNRKGHKKGKSIPQQRNLEIELWNATGTKPTIGHMMRRVEIENQIRTQKNKHRDVQAEFNTKTSVFKNNIKRGNDFLYKNMKKDPPLNEGKYRLKYDSIEERMPVPYITPDQKSEVKNRLYRVPMCVLNQDECNI